MEVKTGNCGPRTFHLLASICIMVRFRGLVRKLGVLLQKKDVDCIGHLLNKLPLEDSHRSEMSGNFSARTFLLKHWVA